MRNKAKKESLERCCFGSWSVRAAVGPFHRSFLFLFPIFPFSLSLTPIPVAGGFRMQLRPWILMCLVLTGCMSGKQPSPPPAEGRTANYWPSQPSDGSSSVNVPTVIEFEVPEVPPQLLKASPSMEEKANKRSAP
jgi:hypothetical protein